MFKIAVRKFLLWSGLVLCTLTLRASAAADLAFQPLQDFPWALNPSSPLVKAPDGYFYGLTIEGGNNNGGTIYRIAPGRNLELVHHFRRSERWRDPNDGGSHPGTALVLANDGCLYGATGNGGAYGLGVIFKYDPAGGVFSVLHNFGPTWHDDGAECKGLFQDTAGDLIGITSGGGPLNGGVIFRLTLEGEYSIVHAFEGVPSYTRSTMPARFPISSPVSVFQASDGRLYGTASVGGATRQDGAWPGRTYGAAFRVEPTGEITILHEFTAKEGGSWNLVEGLDGALYGITVDVLSTHNGTFYRLTKDGQYTTLHSLPLDGSEGWMVRIFRGSDGNFYGSSYYGGEFDAGVIQRYSTTGELTVVHTFPREYREVQRSGLLEADGFLYGTMNRLESMEPEPEPVSDERIQASSLLSMHATRTAERSGTVAAKAVAAPVRRKGGAYRFKIDPLASDNIAPIARSEVRVVNRKLRKLTVPVLANDRDRDGDAIRIKNVVSTEEVTATVDPAGKRLRLTILTPLTHTQSITYTVGDGNGGASQASVLLRPKIAGQYRGTLKVGDVTGTANLVVGSRGAFSGVFKVGSLTYRARGVFGTSDRFTGAARTRTREVLELNLVLGVGAPNTITGSANDQAQQFVVSVAAKR